MLFGACAERMSYQTLDMAGFLGSALALDTLALDTLALDTRGKIAGSEAGTQKSHRGGEGAERSLFWQMQTAGCRE